ncbi:MAG: hypothetical protein Q4Q53_07925, partial [Methanocorpusculum sp.]|nr:hypothetical protein [Methanocorpusculum sp.]
NPEAFEEEKTPEPLKQPESKTAENYFEYEDEDGIFEIDAPTISDEDRFGKVPEEKKDKDLFEISPASEKKNYGSSFDLYADEPKKGSPKK